MINTMPLTHNICINGSRGFTDYNLFKEKIKDLIDLSDKSFLTIIVGGAKGADTLAENWAKENGLFIRRFPADWSRYGKFAGIKRNAEMIDISDRLISFWDGKSSGTKHTIDYARERSIPVTIVNV